MDKTALVEINSHKPILEKKQDGPILLKGVASEAEVKNGNGRIYPRSVMEAAVEKAQAKINEGAFNGELDHPEFGYRGTLSRTAMRFTKLYMEGNEVMFEAILLETPDGQKLKALLEGGVKIGMSTRGAGSLRYEESEGEQTLYVDKDYEMFGIDAVDIPSSANGILRIQESVEQRINEQKGFKMADKVIKTLADLREAHGALVQEAEEAATTALQESEGQKNVALEAKVTELTGQVETLTTQLAEAQKSVTTVEEVKKQLLGESMADKVTDDNVVVGKLDAMLEQFKTLQESHDTLKAEIEKRDQRAVVEAKLNTLFESEVKDDKHEKILRKYVKPTQYESEEALKAKINEYREILGEAPAVITEDVTGKEKGRGEVSEDQTSDDKETLSEAQRVQLALSGLDV